MNNISEQGNSQPLPFQEIQDQSKPEQICSDPTRNVQLELFNFTSHTSLGVFNNYFIVFSRVGVLEAKYCIENFSSKIYGPSQYPLQRTHRGANQLGEDTVSRVPAMWPFLWQVRLSRSSARRSFTTKPFFALPRETRGCMSSSASSTMLNLG